MFAPPPALPLSKAEIEVRKTRLLYGIRKSAESARRRSSQLSDKISPKSRDSQTSDNQSPGSLMRKLAAFGREKIRVARKSIDISDPLPFAPPSASLPPIPKSLPPLPSNVPKKGPPARVDSCSSSPPFSWASSKTAGSDVGDAPRRPPRPISGLLFDPLRPTLSSAPPQQARASDVSSQALHAGLRAESNVRARKRPIDQVHGHLSTDPLRPHAEELSKPAQHAREISPVASDEVAGNSPSSILQTSLELYEAVTPGLDLSVEKKGAALHRLMPILEQSIAQSTIISRRNQTATVESQPGLRCTQIHLRGGSILTVTPPELDPWHRTTYLQGPIRLSKPNAVPRKNSVATLDAFQDAVDKVFKDGESVTKRRSEMAAADEICLFFMNFTLGECRYDADSLAIEGAAYSDESDDEDLSFQCMGREFETPPDSPTAWRSTKPATLTMPALPPVENEETLRARGLDWLARQRKRSVPPSYLPMVPEPEDSMLEVVLAASSSDHKKAVVWEDVEETNAAAPWIRSLSGHKAAVLRRNSQ